jgi:hypothetical protein
MQIWLMRDNRIAGRATVVDEGGLAIRVGYLCTPEAAHVWQGQSFVIRRGLRLRTQPTSAIYGGGNLLVGANA